MRLIENRYLGFNPFRFDFKTKTDEQQWEKFHAHQGLEFLYIYQGYGSMIIDQKIFQIKPKTLICFQPFQLHKINISINQQCPYIRTMLLFSPESVDQFLKPFSSLYSLFKYLYKGKLQQPLFDISNNHKIPELLFEFNQRSKIVKLNNMREEFILFLISFLQGLRDVIPQNSEKISSPNRYLRHIEKALDWIEAHYKEEFILDQLASDLHLSSYHISHLFREEMNCTISEFITVRRIKEACLLLSSTDLSIQTIGKLVGLKSDSYFSYLFKKNIGMTPKQYRTSLKDFFMNVDSDSSGNIHSSVKLT
ncbi:AraC family transcriptional regulator [Propionispora vibrioides]|uniref:AraC-type DNA-binding protein n=1 Tax=Propionispora vibrioides TaxID=112903 RepID=A0A1H8Y1R2_9FIRM|nr:helix-turn-helix domain-containing protein [Propionispora vibrioides]SEP46234.1 AraC-type DNA-binding protein [Propionispora vibrioides]